MNRAGLSNVAERSTWNRACLCPDIRGILAIVHAVRPRVAKARTERQMVRPFPAARFGPQDRGGPFGVFAKDGIR